MSDKPLAEGIENWAKKLEAEWEIEIAQHLRGTILLIKDFAAEHLIEQTEPSAEDEDQAWGIMDHLPELKYGGDYVNHILAKILSDRTNAERRRIRELLVGKEMK